jgi:hypothetical protein
MEIPVGPDKVDIVANEPQTERPIRSYFGADQMDATGLFYNVYDSQFASVP